MMFTIFVIFVFITIVGATLLLDDVAGNDDIGEFFVGAGAMGALIISGIMLWSAA